MPLFPISSFQAAQSGEQNVKVKKDEITVTPEQGGGGGSGVVVEASSNTTVNGYQVPSLTDAQLVTIYNAVVAGKPVTVTDATGTMHFSSLNADSVSGDIYVTILYFDKMILEYSEGSIEYKEIGEGGDTSNCFKYEVKDGDFSATSAQEINTDSQHVQQTFTSLYRNEEDMQQNYSELRVATEGAGIETGYFNSEDSYSGTTFDVEPGKIEGRIEDSQNGTVAIGLGTVNGLNVAFDDAVDPIFNVNRDGIKIGNESLTEEELSAIKGGGKLYWHNINYNYEKWEGSDGVYVDLNYRFLDSNPESYCTPEDDEEGNYTKALEKLKYVLNKHDEDGIVSIGFGLSGHLTFYKSSETDHYKQYFIAYAANSNAGQEGEGLYTFAASNLSATLALPEYSVSENEFGANLTYVLDHVEEVM